MLTSENCITVWIIIFSILTQIKENKDMKHDSSSFHQKFILSLYLKGFIKSLRSLNDHFGSIYINFGDPLSVKDFLGDDLLSSESLKPKDLQQLTPEQFQKVQKVAEYVISLQQKSTVATISNFISLVLMQSIMRNEPLVFEDVINEVKWMMDVLKGLGALVFENDIRSSVEKILVVHNKTMRLDTERRLRLVSGVFMDLSNDVKRKMKGKRLALHFCLFIHR